jgi:hypothetical protein
VAALMPWNAFITITGVRVATDVRAHARTHFQYFTDYKLGNTAYKDDFLKYVGVCSQVPNLTMSFVNLAVTAK